MKTLLKKLPRISDFCWSVFVSISWSASVIIAKSATPVFVFIFFLTYCQKRLGLSFTPSAIDFPDLFVVFMLVSDFVALPGVILVLVCAQCISANTTVGSFGCFNILFVQWCLCSLLLGCRIVCLNENVIFSTSLILDFSARHRDSVSPLCCSSRR